MKKGQFVRIEKLKALNENPSNLEVDYWAEGKLLDDICIGRILFMERIRNSRNPEGRQGYLETTPIQQIIGNVVYTANSAYMITIL